MLIVENFIPKSYQEEIKKLCLHTPGWMYTNDVTFADRVPTKGAAPAMGLGFRMNATTLSPHYNFLAPMAHIACDRVNYDYNDVINCRSFLQFPLSTVSERPVDPCHIDIPKDHLVLLYYVMDSDGDTIFVDKTLPKNNVQESVTIETAKIIKRVTPKQGTAVIFDGRTYHTAEQPKSGMRCIINFDIV
jgi:ectoine hydroxylase-related dioxygenase (phytanoyl-CoA dioxygenase family)